MKKQPKALKTAVKLKPEDEIQILRRITQTISSNLNLEEVLSQIIEIVVKVIKGDSCLIYLFDDEKEELILRASKNPHPKILGKIRLKLGEGITGWVAREKKPVVIPNNASDDPRFKLVHNLPEDRYQSFLSVPIINRDEVIGVINIQHKHACVHNENEIALITTIAQQVGYAIENARLYENTRKRASQLETLSEISKTITSKRYLKEILHLIVTMTAEVTNSKICSIMLLDTSKQELTIEATQGSSGEYIGKPPLKISDSLIGKAIREKRPIIVLDVTKEPGYKYQKFAENEGICSMVAVPMMIKDEIIGVINSYTNTEHKFTKDEIRMFQSIANQAAIAIENTKLMEEAIAAKEALEIRKLTERAKGILMKELKIDENEAYRTIHKKSMDSRRTMKDIAEAIILSAEIKKNKT